MSETPASGSPSEGAPDQPVTPPAPRHADDTQAIPPVGATQPVPQVSAPEQPSAARGQGAAPQYQRPAYGQQLPTGQQASPAQDGPRPSYGQAQSGQSHGGTGYGQPYQQAGSGQQPGNGQQPAWYGQAQSGGAAFTQGGSPGTRQGAKWGTTALVGGMLVAGLLGGGMALGANALMAPNSNGSVAASQNSPVIVNNQDNVNAVTAAAAKASPSVVTIGVTSGNSSGTGSGIVLDGEGHILTNTHVVTLDGQVSSPTVEVRASNGQVYQATIVGTDPLSDLAVIKIDAGKLTPATLGDSGKLNVGDTAVAIGAPLGLDNTVTDGIVSTLNRTISVASSAAPAEGDQSQGDEEGFQFAPPGGGQSQRQTAQGSISINVIQTDAAINPGNSGGALVNSAGEVVGVNVAIASAGSDSSGSSSGNIGVGFSIPMNYAERIAGELIENGKASHGQLGVSVQPKSANGSASSFSAGAEVADVTADSAAAKAGIKKGDVITQFAGRPVTEPGELTAVVREQAPGSTVKVTLLRDGKSMEVDVTLGAAASS